MTSRTPKPNAKSKPPAIEPFYDIRGVAEVLDLSPKSVCRKINAGEIRIHRFGTRIRISPDDLNAYIARNRE